jgi:flagellar basal-body rod protein FlgB
VEHQLHLCGFVIDSLTNNIERYMDLLAARQKLVTSNIANADTPGYKTQDLDFQRDFQSLLDTDTAQPTKVAGLPSKNDGNNVDLDREARLLAENALRFSVASNLMRSQLKLVHDAIKEGQSS